MLFNVPASAQAQSQAPITGAVHETITIPATEAVKASFTPATQSFGAIVNGSGLGSNAGATVYFKAVAVGASAPTRESILADGIPLLPSGSIFEIPVNAQLEIYLAAELAVSVKGLYFAK